MDLDKKMVIGVHCSGVTGGITRGEIGEICSILICLTGTLIVDTLSQWLVVVDS